MKLFLYMFDTVADINQSRGRIKQEVEHGRRATGAAPAIRRRGMYRRPRIRITHEAWYYRLQTSRCGKYPPSYFKVTVSNSNNVAVGINNSSEEQIAWLFFTKWAPVRRIVGLIL